MNTYRYKAQNAAGKTVNGIVNAPDEFSAVQKVRETAPVILEITPVKSDGEKKGLLSMDIGGKPKVKADSLAMMCSQFSIMLQSGIQIARCIELVANQTEDKRLKKILQNIADDVADGGGVASSFERDGEGIFPVTFIETLRAGELAGTMEQSFDQLQDYFNKSYSNSEKIKSAMSYPIFVVIVAIVVVIVIMVKVVPTLTNVFASMGGELPAITQSLVATSNFFAHWWHVILIVILAIVVGSKLYFGTEKGRLVKGKMLLKLPIIGNLNILSGSAQFASTMSVMLLSGLTVNRATEVTSRVMTNAIMQDDIAAMTGRLEEGRPLGECIMKCEYFPENLRQMTAIGEETGELAETLRVVGDYYTNEADHATAAAVAKLEPTMMVFLAAFAGWIVIAIYMPMFTMYKLF